MYKLSINKDLFENILLKKTLILEKENTNYWKKELLEAILKDDKLTYEIKQFKKKNLALTYGQKVCRANFEALQKGNQ